MAPAQTILDISQTACRSLHTLGWLCPDRRGTTNQEAKSGKLSGRGPGLHQLRPLQPARCFYRVLYCMATTVSILQCTVLHGTYSIYSTVHVPCCGLRRVGSICWLCCGRCQRTACARRPASTHWTPFWSENAHPEGRARVALVCLLGAAWPLCA